MPNTINKVDKYPQKGIVGIIELEELCKIKDCPYFYSFNNLHYSQI